MHRCSRASRRALVSVQCITAIGQYKKALPGMACAVQPSRACSDRTNARIELDGGRATDSNECPARSRAGKRRGRRSAVWMRARGSLGWLTRVEGLSSGTGASASAHTANLHAAVCHRLEDVHGVISSGALCRAQFRVKGRRAIHRGEEPAGARRLSARRKWVRTRAAVSTDGRCHSAETIVPPPTHGAPGDTCAVCVP